MIYGRYFVEKIENEIHIPSLPQAVLMAGFSWIHRKNSKRVCWDSQFSWSNLLQRVHDKNLIPTV